MVLVIRIFWIGNPDIFNTKNQKETTTRSKSAGSRMRARALLLFF